MRAQDFSHIRQSSAHSVHFIAFDASLNECRMSRRQRRRWIRLRWIFFLLLRFIFLRFFFSIIFILVVNVEWNWKYVFSLCRLAAARLHRWCAMDLEFSLLSFLLGMRIWWIDDYWKRKKEKLMELIILFRLIFFFLSFSTVYRCAVIPSVNIGGAHTCDDAIAACERSDCSDNLWQMLIT